MKQKKSLVYRTLMQLFACSAIIFLLMTPAFYLLTKHFYAEDLIDVIAAVEKGLEIPPLDLERDIMAGVMLQFLLIFATMTVALFITMRFITRRLWQPFDDTLLKAESFNLAQSDVPEFEDNGILEFARLNDSLRLLMSRSKETYRIQKEFTENASHELRTPLAVTRSKLDLLMQEELTEIQASIVSELYRLNTRMEHLNRNLLLLAKIENKQYHNSRTIELGSFIKALLPQYDMHRPGCNVVCTTGGAQTVTANAMLFECMLSNLIINAIRHTDSGTVVIDLRRDAVIEISNPAAGGPLDESAIFRRFHSGTKGGNGLGLAIVKAICDYHRWSVGYSYADARHIFTIKTN